MNETQRVRFDAELIRNIAENRNVEVKSMLKQDLINAFDGFGTLLHYAAAWGNATIARHLINNGSALDSLGKDGRTPLAISVEYQQVEAAKILLEAGASVEIVSDNGKSALQIVFGWEQRNFEITRAFIRKVRTEASTTEEFVGRLFAAGCTLHHAVKLKEVEILKGLLQRGFDVNFNRFETALHIAVRKNSFEMAKILIENGADVNTFGGRGNVPLVYAARQRTLAMVQLLLQAGADPSIQHRLDKFYTPFLELFTIDGSTRYSDRNILDACVAIFLQHGAMPKKRYGIKIVLDCALKLRGSRGIDHLIAHLAMLEAIEGPDRASIKRCGEVRYRSKIVKLKNYYKLCQRILKKKVFGSLSLFDLLAGNGYQVRLCARNETFVSEVEKFCAEQMLRASCPYYYIVLMRRISEATRTVKLEDQAIPVICEIFQRNENECYVAARTIFGYLGERDLKQLVKCCIHIKRC